MRILHVLSQRPGRSGSGVFFKALVREADRRGYEQHAAVGGPPGTTHLETPPLRSDEFSLIAFPSPQAPFPVPGMSDVMPYPSTVFSQMGEEQVEQYLSSCRAVLEKVRRTFRPQLVHAHHLWLITSLARQVFADVPLVATAHNSELRQLVKAPHLAGRVLEGIRRVDRICVLTPRSKLDTEEGFQADPAKIAVTAAGFPGRHFCPAQRPLPEIRRELAREFGIRLPQPGVRLVTFAGRLSSPKGVPFLLDAARRIERNEGPHFRLVLVGAAGSGEDGRMVAQMAEKTAPLAVGLGAVPHRAVALILQCSDLFVLPSLYEGLPLVMLEAAACGCPVLVSGLPTIRSWATREWLESGCFDFIPALETAQADLPVEADVPRFVRAIAELVQRRLENPPSAADRRRFAQLAAKHSWSAVFGRYEQVYRALL